jgi:hypothetical protein
MSDELSPRVVAAIVALLEQMIEDEPEQPERASSWARSGRVEPSWAERGRRCWRDGERERGWR